MSDDKTKKEDKEVQEVFDKNLPKVTIPQEVADKVKEKTLEEVKKVLGE